MDVIAIAKAYNCRPSDIVDVDNSYTAFCFDRACLYIQQTIEEKKPLYFPEDEGKRKQQGNDFIKMALAVTGQAEGVQQNGNINTI